MKKNSTCERNNPVPALVAAATLLLLILLAGSRGKEHENEFKNASWQLETQAPAPDVPSGFEGLAFTGTNLYDANAAFFRLTKDSDTGIQYAYVPAEMSPDAGGPLHLRLHDRERLEILDSGGDSVYPAGDSDHTGADLEETSADPEEAGADPEETGADPEETGADPEEAGSASESSGSNGSVSDGIGSDKNGSNGGSGSDDIGSNSNNGSDSSDDGSASGFYRQGDALPLFKENEPYTFTILDEDGQTLGTETVVFLYTQNVPSMYIQTESGSMEAIDGDKHHETSETASYRIYQTDGTPDSSGQCSIKGRGNSTWSQKKRPYNLNFTRENTILGMDSCRKYALIANFWDSTQTRQYYAFLAADRLGLAFTPQTGFVNLYLNGKYQSLYLLTQRINPDGGTVQIRDLDQKNERANPQTPEDKAETVVMETDEDGHEALAMDWPNEPQDISGGYLIEFQNRYDLEDFWFSTKTRHMSFKSPQQPSVAEYEYISSYVREAETALFADTDSTTDAETSVQQTSVQQTSVQGSGTSADSAAYTGGGDDPKASAESGNPASGSGAGKNGKNVWDYFDMDSWARMYLIQDFFVQSDDEFYSFFFYKKTGDPLLYCGPVWDFDLCLGNMNCGDYYKTSAQTLWLRDGRKRWLHQMDLYPEFRARVAQLYLEELEPIIRDLLENEYEQTVARLETDTKLNYLRWHKNLDYQERTGLVKTLLESRVQFLHDYYTDPDAFHRLLFHFAWDDFSYYVRDGETMGFLPTYDYGEKQSSVQREANGFITGWQDPETGELLGPDTIIDHDMEFDPVYIP